MNVQSIREGRRCVLVTEKKTTTRREQAQESRKRLMEGALGLFARNGVAATSVHAICQSLGVADSLLYHYFPGGKQELLQSIAQENVQKVMEELNAQNDRWVSLPIEQVLEQVFLSTEAIVLRHEDALRLLIRERELLEQSRILDLFAERKQWFPVFLRHRARQGEIKEIDFDSAAEALDALMLHHLVMRLLHLSGSPLADETQREKMIAYQVGLWKPLKNEEKEL